MAHEANPADKLLCLSSVSKSFGPVQVLRDIGFEVRAGEVICLLGHSGSGKTTLLRCVNGLADFQRGRIRFSGRSPRTLLGSDEPDYRELCEKDFAGYRTHIGMVFQRFNLFSHLPALDNVAIAPRKVLGLSKPNAAARARELLALVGLDAKAGLYPKQLSGGQQQRVAIARALAMEPEIILFDEPTSALDPELVGEVLGTMRKLATQGVTMLVATHEMSFAREVATRVLFLQNGSIIEDETPEEFFTRPKHEPTQRFLARMHKSWQN
jgi:ABC-type polar amino acid transport system ATPase subunit